MFYKHWKKIALALTGFFWASCDDSASSAVCLYGPDPNYSDPAENPTSSSSEATGNETVSSSSEASKPESSSSEIEMQMPLYGVIMDTTLCTQVKGDPTITCNDGTVCTQKTEERWGGLPCSNDICPDYGVVQISENTYECDGKVYSEAEFRARYGKITVVEEPEQDSISMQPALYGPPCVFNGTCDDEKE
ncbi:hypothetical protein SAMN05720487_104111 [Fibrobacter sp. UWT2]|jgi:hypothetical protein|uniref:hypothetical protein n=1 Tax=Fibrobacter sp. UWT2 TaxID=1896224 RepID=UPI00091A9A6B|nr:hypothetical protein [Fibrobacter sp. UWT2]SHK74216.1 hypothetical protein SAMN05720487_104111 [Fibrobacter sp. UWT2]